MKRFLNFSLTFTIIALFAGGAAVSSAQTATGTATSSTSGVTGTSAGTVETTQTPEPPDAPAASFDETEANCTLNGEPVPCEEVAGWFGWIFGAGAAFLVLFGLITLAIFIFWLLMLIHAARNSIENRNLWIVIHIIAFLTGLALISAVAYYFIVKRPFDQAQQYNGGMSSDNSQEFNG